MKAKKRFSVAREAQGFPNWELLALGIRLKPSSWTPASDWAPIRLVTVSFWLCLPHVMLEVRIKARGCQLYFFNVHGIFFWNVCARVSDLGIIDSC